MASAYDQNVYTPGSGSPGSTTGGTYTYGNETTTTEGDWRVNSEGQTVVQLPGGGHAVVNMETGVGFIPGVGQITFTPGLTGENAVRTIAAFAAMGEEARAGGAVSGTTASGRYGSSSTASGSRAGSTGGSAASGGQFGSLLRQYGLEELIPMVDAWTRDGLTWAEIESQLLDVNTSAGQVVDRIYPELRLRRDAGKTSMTIREVREWRDGASAILRQAGMPTTFYDDPSDFLDWIVGDVDLSEFSERVGVAVGWAAQAPAETRQALKDLYGVDEGGIAAYVLDKNRALPALQRQQAATSLAGASLRTGFGSLSAFEAERLASLGVTDQQAEAGFGTLAESGEVLNGLTGQQTDTIGRDTQLGAVAGDVASVRSIEEAARRRGSTFRGGGGFSESNEGLSGFGTAR